MATYNLGRLVGATARPRRAVRHFRAGVVVGLAIAVAAHLMTGGRVVEKPCTPGSGGTVEAPALPAQWQAFQLPAGFVCPMCAQLALARGAPWAYSGGALLIDGRTLIGRSGGSFAFASAITAARWVDLNIDRAVLELAALDKLDVSGAAAWKVQRAAVLEDYAARVIAAAAKVQDATRRAAMVSESNYARLKWAI
jgi:hypothetical protein